MVGPGPIPFGEFYRFARVVEAHLPPGSGRVCARCESRAHWRIVVAWEAGYASPNGNTLCERCIDGVVVSGAEDLIFPNA
jgi:hypothetical protein